MNVDEMIGRALAREREKQHEQAQPVAWIDAVMEQAQVFASAWSLVGGCFDNGSDMEDAEQAKAELRAMLTTPPRQSEQAEQAQPVGEVYRYGKDSKGSEWHGIHWYDANVSVPTGTKLYTTPTA